MLLGLAAAALASVLRLEYFRSVRLARQGKYPTGPKWSVYILGILEGGSGERNFVTLVEIRVESAAKADRGSG